MNILL
jgi:hypothetical protein